MLIKIKAWAKKLKRQIFILCFACKDNRVPWYAKVFTANGWGNPERSTFMLF
jgi:uncharacterized membrane protein YkvA (DUF1232 family)